MSDQNDARNTWLNSVRPAMSRLRDAAKDDASGITPRDIAEVSEAIAELIAALGDFEVFTDGIE